MTCTFPRCSCPLPIDCVDRRMRALGVDRVIGRLRPGATTMRLFRADTLIVEGRGDSMIDAVVDALRTMEEVTR